MHEYDLPIDRFGDAQDRYERDLEFEQRDHEDAVIRERLYEHRPARPDPKPAARVKRKDAPKPSVAWKLEVLDRDQGCCFHLNPNECEEGFQAHHIVAAQELRRQHPYALWRRESGMGLCGLAHRRFHARHTQILREQIPAESIAFLEELGYGWYLDKHYPRRQQVAA